MRGLVKFRLDRSRPQNAIGDILEFHGQGRCRAIDCHVSKKLQTEARCEIVTLFVTRGALKYDRWAERAVERAWSPRSRVDWTGNEFPKWLEILEYCLIGIEKVRGRVVQVGGDPHRVANAGILHEA